MALSSNEILVVYGKDIAGMAVRLAQEADLAGLAGDREKRIGIKPNLVTVKPASTGATTHPEIAAGVILYLKKNGFNDITILEGSGVGESTAQAFKVCGFEKLANETGAKLINTKNDKTRMCDCMGMKLEICESALAIDFLINLPVMKGHCQTRLTCALKNCKGLIPDGEKRRYHSLGLSKPIAHLNTAIHSGFIIVDGICGDIDFELGGNPLYSGRLYAATDPVLCDAWTASQMGYSVADIPYIGLAEKLGVGSADLKKLQVRELNTAESGASPLPSGKVKEYSSFINEDKACSVCYSSLIYALSKYDKGRLPRIKEKICIGQGFQNKQDIIGIGKCCANFKFSCPGCPPSGLEILEFLRNNF
jgi:uncharacterized protein (DUF362 family)